MKTIVRLLCCFAVLAASVALAADRIATIRTRDGKTYKGKVLQETDKGYVLRTETDTKLIEYSRIDDLHIDGEVPATNLAVPLPPPAPPSTPAPVAQPPPPPPPSAAPASELDAVVAPKDWQEANRGMHLGFGASALLLPWAAVTDFPLSAGVRAQFHLSFGFGLVDVRISPTFGLLYTSYRAFSVATFHGAVETSARLNLARVFAIGIGTYQGVALGTGGGCFGSYCSYVSGASLFFMPALYPAIFRFGELAKNELSVALMFPLTLAPETTASPFPFVAVAFNHVF